MGRHKPWFGPLRAFRRVAVPVSWEGYAATAAFALSLVLLKLVEDPTRRAIAMVLTSVGFAVIVFLTWGDEGH